MRAAAKKEPDPHSISGNQAMGRSKPSADLFSLVTVGLQDGLARQNDAQPVCIALGQSHLDPRQQVGGGGAAVRKTRH